MRVVILDVDWWNELSDIPNPLCMKLSSYHKQLKDVVTFAKDEYDIRLQYDLLYAVRENIRGELPADLDLLDERVNLIGNGMRFYSRYVDKCDDPVINGCRPDYTLYPITERTKANQSDVVQFYQDGKLIKIQDYHNSYERAKDTNVLDKDFWDHSENDVSKCCRRMKNDYSIRFAGVVNMNNILNSKIKTNWFLKLNVDYSHTTCIIDLKNKENFKSFESFMQKYKEKVTTRHFYIEMNLYYSPGHLKNEKVIFEDFFKYFKLIVEARRCGISLLVKTPSRLLSPYWFFFEDLQNWTYNMPESSFVEYMTYITRRYFKYSVEECIKDEKHWHDDDVDRLVKLWKRFPELMSAYGYIQWKNNKYEEFNMNEFIRRHK